jgi:hypothetical protein
MIDLSLEDAKDAYEQVIPRAMGEEVLSYF